MTMKSRRMYCFRLGPALELQDHPWTVRIMADSMTKRTPAHFVLHRDGEMVAEVSGNVAAWWMEEEVQAQASGK